MNIIDRASLSATELAGFASNLGELQTLSDVLRWARAQPKGSLLPAVIGEFVVQDEFTHDAVIPLRKGRALVFGLT
jgi:hypothetical protein